jgi:predicted small lipoprotein YifL
MRLIGCLATLVLALTMFSLSGCGHHGGNLITHTLI